jgi:flagellar basal body-associated protein FliL
MDTTYGIIILFGIIMLAAGLLALGSWLASKSKYKQPKKPVTWYWEKRTDFTGKTYYFPKHREQHTCKCNHHKNHRHDISGQD